MTIRSKAMSRLPCESWKASSEQRDLLERFEVAYNSIDRWFRKRLSKDRTISFTALLSEFQKTARTAVDCDYLRMIAELRNVLVHEKTKPYQPVAIPTEPVVEALERIWQRLTNPPLVIPRFQRRVETVSLDDTLAHVLNLISQRDYSQFPVYTGEHFRGLLTENGITRWLAHHVSTAMSLVELNEIPVRKVLPEEEKRPNWMFTNRTTTVDDVRALFVAHGLLEAVLITQTGNRKENAMGIVTRWDVLHDQ